MTGMADAMSKNGKNVLVLADGIQNKIDEKATKKEGFFEFLQSNLLSDTSS